MRTILTIICSLALTLTGLTVASAGTTAPTTDTVSSTTTTVTTDRNATPSGGIYTRARVLSGSDRGITVASGQNGQGRRAGVFPGGVAPFDTDSIYVSPYCTTKVNGIYRAPGWHNTRWWFEITADVQC